MAEARRKGEQGNLESFLRTVHGVRATGAAVPETSYYPAISQLLERVGAALKPPVKPVIHIRDQGSGIPDGGLFVVRPSGPVNAPDPMQASAPERGAIEVKPPSRDLKKVLATPQIRSYLERYGKVLVTTLREWTLATIDKQGRIVQGETFQIAANEKTFWALAADPAKWSAEGENDFVQFLRRAMEHEAPLGNPRDLAWVLAAHARTALRRIEGRDVHALDQLRDALSESLGLTFRDEEGESFFRSTLVQTLFYGIFSAWVLWHQAQPSSSDRFQWRQAAWHMRVPMVSVLFEKIATPSTLKPLGIEEIMDWTEDVLARVDPDRFFANFEQARAVQYFYEPFLAHFDKRLQEQFGVWYTPPEVVNYIVERVDQKLRSDFEIEKGLADERVVVLDPAAGTGSFLLAVLRRIHDEFSDDALAAQDVKQAATSRIFGFEILPAPFVVAHLQLGLLLDQLGAPLDQGSRERAAVYLTNALTGWAERPKQGTLPFPELEEEREAAQSVKQKERILVVLGNPPYYPFAGVHSEEEEGLIEPYKRGITTKHSLNDLYVRFFRVAERRIVEGTGHGIVCFITNFSYLHEPGFVQMRRRLLEEFDEILIDNLNGDSRETGKQTPDGKPDPSIFTTPFNPQGIQVGTAISLLIRRQNHEPGTAMVRYREFWGQDKREELLRVARSQDPEVGYEVIQLSEVNRMAFRPARFSSAYEAWPRIVELAAADPSLGLNENRGGVLIDPDRDALAARIAVYLDSSVSNEDLRSTEAEPLTRAWARFKPEETRTRLIAKGGFDPLRLVRFLTHPLDLQWAYIDPASKLWNEVRSRDLLPHAKPGNRFLLVRRRAPRLDDGAALLPATCLGDQHVLHKDAYFIPSRLHQPAHPQAVTLLEEEPQPNLAPATARYLASIGIDETDGNFADLVWWHALAVGYSSRYLEENKGGIAADWPRIPLPSSANALRTSGALGRELADLLDPLAPPPKGIPGVLGALKRTDGGAAQPQLGHLDVTARWGVAQKSGAVMPGPGKLVRRTFTEQEEQALGTDSVRILQDACDVYLNPETYWACIPGPVWELKIGGFQVLKKWLSYREYGDGPPLLGRSLTVAEAREFTALTQRLIGLLLMTEKLDANYAAIVEEAVSWTSY
jgi:hypothetical protein